MILDFCGQKKLSIHNFTLLPFGVIVLVERKIRQSMRQYNVIDDVKVIVTRHGRADKRSLTAFPFFCD